MLEIEDIEKKKKSLILELMHDKFEENMKEQISARSWASVDELDAYLDQQLQKFYEECDAVSNYYDKRIEEY